MRATSIQSILVIYTFLRPCIGLTYTLQTNGRLMDGDFVIADNAKKVPIIFLCSVDSGNAALEWYFNGRLPSVNDSKLGILTSGVVTKSASRASNLSVIPMASFDGATVSCGPLPGADGPSSSTITLILLHAPPSLLKGYPTAVQLSPNSIQFSWNGSKDDFIDYFMVTILNGTAVLMEYNTTEVQFNMTFTCGVVYRCSVVPVNMVGEGHLSSVDYEVPCVQDGIKSSGSLVVIGATSTPPSKEHNDKARLQIAIIISAISGLTLLIAFAAALGTILFLNKNRRSIAVPRVGSTDQNTYCYVTCRPSSSSSSSSSSGSNGDNHQIEGADYSHLSHFGLHTNVQDPAAAYSTLAVYKQEMHRTSL